MKPAMELKLIGFAEQELKLPFEWGFRDCNTLALRCLDLITGGQYAAAVLGRYDTEKSAQAFQASFGRRIEDVLKEAGAVQVRSGFEQTGDFLVVDDGRWPWQLAHVCIGGKVISAGPETGVEMFKLSQIKPHTTWRIV